MADITYLIEINAYVGTIHGRLVKRDVAATGTPPAEVDLTPIDADGTLHTADFTIDDANELVGDWVLIAGEAGEDAGSRPITFASGQVDYRFGTSEMTGLPSTNDVRSGVTFGDVNQFTGNVIIPTPAEVLFGVGFGSLGVEFTGLLAAAGGTTPATEDVRFGVEYGTDLVGVFQSPEPDLVLLDAGYGAYGTEFIGELNSVPAAVTSPESPVCADGTIRSPLLIGNSYSESQEFSWLVSEPSNGLIEDFTATFTGHPVCDSSDEEWSVTGELTDNLDGTWTVTFEMLSAVSAAIAAGEYHWHMTLKLIDESWVIAKGNVDWIA